MEKKLAQYFTLKRRYSRSVNLERDFAKVDALDGYVLTRRSLDVLRRILFSIHDLDANRSWTLTSVYGTGKSAFAHYLSCLFFDSNSLLRNKALAIAKSILGADSEEYQSLFARIPSQGFFCAVATGAREPITHTIIRGLRKGIEHFWQGKNQEQIAAVDKLIELEKKINQGKKINSQALIKLIIEIAEAGETSVFLIIDELGKNLEYAVYNQGAEDLYLLQQLAELPKNTDSQIYLLGILHQAFADYSQRLATIQRNEWAKIQGRFEDIPFTESATEMMRLISQTIDATKAEPIRSYINNHGEEWYKKFQSFIPEEELTVELLAKIYPLHPVSALVLPTLCQRYAQNDRSLFTFLTSTEPYSLHNFLEENTVKNEPLPTLKLERIYDYFVEAAGLGLASRPQLQRWVEIQDLIADCQYLDLDSLMVLKTIGILNLVTTVGINKATRHLVTLALCDNPADEKQEIHWEQVINQLLSKGIINHIRQSDELRIWQGSDFNVDNELNTYLQQDRASLVELLSDVRPLSALVANRHSYRTGTLRYFERCYLDSSTELKELLCVSSDTDGLIGYWLDEKLPNCFPQSTADGKPLVVVCANNLELLRIRAREFAALKKIQNTAPELQSDGVARREVRYRLVEAETLLDDTLAQVFDFALNKNRCWVQGKAEIIKSITDFNSELSLICDRVYNKSPILWNELINRRELSSQGAAARRQLIEAMLAKSDRERLGLEGYGPEVSMYYSVLSETGIHRKQDGHWGIYPPEQNSKIWTLWEAVESFCLQSTEKARSLEQLYKSLENPPLGVKQGIIPILIAAVLLYHIDDVGVYRDGSFVPVLTQEHFELLIKDSSRFAVKYFEMVGISSQVFQELESILRNPKQKKYGKLRNATLLNVVTPLYQFKNGLPKYTKQTKRLSQEALRVLQALDETVEPDQLLFTKLPQACNLPPIGTGKQDDGIIAKNLRNKLVQVLREIHRAYEHLLSECQSLLYDAFGISNQETYLRQDLSLRVKPLVGKSVERTLNSFINAIGDDKKTDKDWLESAVMIIADKPPESWTDEDVTGFDVKLSDLVRRFKNLEALQKEIPKENKGLEARRITVTRPDGQEAHQMVWVDHQQEEEIERLVNKVVEMLPKDKKIRQGVIARLTEILLSN